MPTFLTTPQTVSLTGYTASTWTTYSSGAPAGASGVILQFNTGASAAPPITTRMTGSTDSQTSSQAATNSNQWTSITGVNGSGQFDLFSTVANLNGVTCWLIGYFGTEATFFTNATVLSPTLTGSYQSFNVSSSCPNALAVMLDLLMGGGALFVRQNGSTDTTTDRYFGGQSIIMGVDGSQIFNAENSNVGGTLYVKGYLTSGITWHQNAVTLGGSFTSGSFQNISQAAGDPASPVGYIYQPTNTANKFTICGPSCNTTTYNPQLISMQSGGSQVFSAGSPAQINPVSATQPLYELAYFTSTTVSSSQGIGSVQAIGPSGSPAG